MKRKIIITTILAIVACLMLAISPAFAAPNGKAKDHCQGLYLYEKDPATWEVLQDGAWGKYNYKLNGTTISGTFNGHDLDEGIEYSLISYPESYPNVNVIGSAIADEYGNVHIQAEADIGEPNVYSSTAPGDYQDMTGYKIWLVPTSRLSGSNLSGWHPEDYLFEYKLIP